MTKPTLGSIVAGLSQKVPESTDPIELQRAMQEDYMKHLMEAVDRGYKRYTTDFFIHVEVKAEKILANTFRHYFIDRVTCPTPNYDQTVFKYNKLDGQIEYIWTIPDRETCHHLIEHALEVVPDERELLSFCIKFANGTLFKLCKKLNGEKLDTPELEKKDLTFSVSNS